MKPIRLLTPLALLTLVACSAAPSDEGTGASNDALGIICKACGPFPPPPPPKPSPITSVPACGATGLLRQNVSWFGAGWGVVHGADAVYGDPLVYWFTLDWPLAHEGDVIPGLSIDGAAIKAFAEVNADGTVTGAFNAGTFDASTPLTHTISFSGSCGTSSKSITLTPHPPTAPSFAYQITGSSPGHVDLWYHETFDASTCADTTQEAIVDGQVVGTTMNGPISLSKTSTVTINARCTKTPSATRTTTFTVPVSQPPPTIGSFTVTPYDSTPDHAYITVGDKVTFGWSTSIPNCAKPEVALVATNLGDASQVVFQKTGLATSGTLDVKPNEEGLFHLFAECKDDGRVTQSAPIYLHLYAPPAQQSGKTVCFEATCTYAGCTTQAVYVPTGTDASALIASIYPSSSGCTATTIDCGQMASACPDPFAP